MADITITGVVPLEDVEYDLVDCGATVAIGEPVYEDSNDEEYKPGDADDVNQANVEGIAIHASADGQKLFIVKKGLVQLTGATLVVGEPYVVSTNTGKIAPETDLTTGDYVTRLGTAKTATQLDIDIQVTGYVHA